MKTVSSALSAALLSLGILITASMLSSCDQGERPQEPNLGATIRDIAERAEPLLRGQNLRFTGTVIDAGDGVCACIRVCNGAGENCTSCVCSPANCGTCD